MAGECGLCNGTARLIAAKNISEWNDGKRTVILCIRCGGTGWEPKVEKKQKDRPPVEDYERRLKELSGMDPPIRKSVALALVRWIHVVEQHNKDLCIQLGFDELDRGMQELGLDDENQNQGEDHGDIR